MGPDETYQAQESGGDCVKFQDFQFGEPLSFQHLTFLPVVRQILVRTPEWLFGAVSPVAVVILDGKDVRLAILDDRISEPDLICWLAKRE